MDFPQMSTSPVEGRLLKARQSALKPRPKLNLIEWADQFRFVAKANSANPGRWQTARVPAAYGPYLAITEKDTHTVTVMAGTQVMKTEFLLNVAGFFIHSDPSSILFIQPTQGLAESFSKERFAPTRASTPILAALIPDAKSRDSGVTITHKEYPGGTLDFVGANSPVDLASRPKRIVLADEIDKYPASAGSEGDPLALGEERASTFWNRKKVRACSPTNDETSRINREYLASDQRRCFVSCPHCGHDQTLRWSESSVIWNTDGKGNPEPETATYHCEECGAGWSEAERVRALRDLVNKPDRGWRQTRRFMCCDEDQDPSVWSDSGRALCRVCATPMRYEGHAGFHLSKLYSTRHKLAELVAESISAKASPEHLRKFVNTALAETWKEKIEVLDARALAARREAYGFLSAPAAVRLVVFGADTQDDRIEVTFLGYGDDEEVWVLRHEVILGDTSEKVVWDQLDKLIKEPAVTVDGRRLVAQAGCIDSQGHRGAMVHSFCRSKERRRVYAVKGIANDARGSKLIWPKTPSRTKNSGDKLYVVGVDTAKDALAASLSMLPDPSGEPTPRATHFPLEDLSADYFDQLTAEKAVTVYQHNSAFRRWVLKERDLRNEALDCFVYATAARLSLPMRLDRKTARKEQKKRKIDTEVAEIDNSDADTRTEPQKAAEAHETNAARLARRQAWARR